MKPTGNTVDKVKCPPALLKRVRLVHVVMHDGKHKARSTCQTNTQPPDVLLRGEVTYRCTDAREVILSLQRRRTHFVNIFLLTMLYVLVSHSNIY